MIDHFDCHVDEFTKRNQDHQEFGRRADIGEVRNEQDLRRARVVHKDEWAQFIFHERANAAKHEYLSDEPWERDRSSAVSLGW